MMPYLSFAGLFLLGISTPAFTQTGLQVYNLASSQLRVMKTYEKTDSLKRSKVFYDSIYVPYKTIWDGYMGNGDEVVKWTNDHLAMLPEMMAKSKNLNIRLLTTDLSTVALEMETLSGFKPLGNWYIFYGAAWTDLGALGNEAMIIDLSHSSNSSHERIKKMFPHELTHQIMIRSNPHQDTTAISSILGEGFAVWMSKKYWGSKYSLADLLGYSEEELQLCDKNLEALKTVYLKYRDASDADIINLFRNRDVKLNGKLPGAIGYYIGYRIVEAYVAKFGENAYKDIFTKPVKDIAELSGF